MYVGGDVHSLRKNVRDVDLYASGRVLFCERKTAQNVNSFVVMLVVMDTMASPLTITTPILLMS